MIYSLTFDLSTMLAEILRFLLAFLLVGKFLIISPVYCILWLYATFEANPDIPKAVKWVYGVIGLGVLARVGYVLTQLVLRQVVAAACWLLGWMRVIVGPVRWARCAKGVWVVWAVRWKWVAIMTTPGAIFCSPVFIFLAVFGRSLLGKLVCVAVLLLVWLIMLFHALSLPADLEFTDSDKLRSLRCLTPTPPPVIDFTSMIAKQCEIEHQRERQQLLDSFRKSFPAHYAARRALLDASDFVSPQFDDDCDPELSDDVWPFKDLEVVRPPLEDFFMEVALKARTRRHLQKGHDAGLGYRRSKGNIGVMDVSADAVKSRSIKGNCFTPNYSVIIILIIS